jgi:hypothetical protein
MSCPTMHADDHPIHVRPHDTPDQTADDRLMHVRQVLYCYNQTVLIGGCSATGKLPVALIPAVLHVYGMYCLHMHGRYGST